MKTFSEVTNSSGNLTGDKYHIDDILNREIHLKGFEIKASKYKGECLIIQYDIYEQVKDKTGALLTNGLGGTYHFYRFGGSYQTVERCGVG